VFLVSGDNTLRIHQMKHLVAVLLILFYSASSMHAFQWAVKSINEKTTFHLPFYRSSVGRSPFSFSTSLDAVRKIPIIEENSNGKKDIVVVTTPGTTIPVTEHLTDSSKGFEASAMNCFDSYNHCLINYPYKTKILSSMVIAGLGDFLSQVIVPYFKDGIEAPTLNLKRLFIFSLVAGLYFAPVIHLWFNWLNSIQLPSFSEDQRKNKVMKALTMITLDQTIGAFFINAGFFYAFELVRMLLFCFYLF
jgi:hypothetical protein